MVLSKKIRTARFKVTGVHIDGKKEATLEIQREGPHPLVTVRPKGSRSTYAVTLPIVAEMVVARAVKAGIR